LVYEVFMTRAHRVLTVVEPNRSLHFANLPFDPGRQVEVIFLEPTIDPVPAAKPDAWRKLKGAILRYDDPTLPVGVED
jgi:hypothetical protein